MHLWEHFPDAVEEEWLVQDVPEVIDDVADESQPETETIIQFSMSRDMTRLPESMTKDLRLLMNECVLLGFKAGFTSTLMEE